MRTKLLCLATLIAAFGSFVAIIPMDNHSAEATLPGRLGRIAFISFAGGEQHVWTMDQTGGDRQQLSDGNSDDYTPVWSPDGTRVLYRANYNSGGTGLRIADFGTTNDDGVSGTDDAFLPRWSPEGFRIIFGADLGGQLDIIEMDLTTKNTTNLTETTGRDETSPVFSPDGSMIAFIAQDASGSDIYTIPDAILAVPVPVTNSPADIKSQVDFSPDGKTLVFEFTTDSGVTSHIARINVDGTGYHQLTTGSSYDIFPRFSPDGKTIIFQRRPALNPNAVPQGTIASSIIRMDAGGGNEGSLSLPLNPQDLTPDWQSIPYGVESIAWGDNDCDHDIDGFDVLALLIEQSGVNNTQASIQGVGCVFPLGATLLTGAYSTKSFGDLDCAGSLDSPDLRLLLRFIVGLHPANLQNCPAIGIDVALKR